MMHREGPRLTTGVLIEQVEPGYGFRAYTVLASAVGVSRSLFKVGSGEVNLIRSVRIAFTASAVAGNRNLVLQLRDPDGNVVFESPSTLVVAAAGSQTITFCNNNAGAGFTAGTVGLFPLWNDFLEPGWEVFVSTINGDAGDTFSSVRIIREALTYGHDGYYLGRKDRDGSEWRQNLGL